MNRMGIAVLFTVNFLCLLAGSAFGISWAKVYDHAAAMGNPRNEIQPTSDGGYIVASTIAGNDAIWVMKLTSTGSVSWQKSYGGAGTQSLGSIRPTRDGGYVVLAETTSFGAWDVDGWVLKLDSNGKVQWQNTYGGIGYDSANTIQQTTDEGFIFAGYTESFTNDPEGDAWAVKINSSGAIIWAKSYGSSATFEDITHIEQTSDGGFICAGDREDDAWVMKLTPTGKIKWQKTYGGSAGDHSEYVQQTYDGGFVVAGNTDSFGAGSGDFWVFKLNSSGTMQWQKTYGGPSSERLYQLDYTSDLGYVLTGYTFSFGPAMRNAWTLKLDSSGEISWQKTYGGGNSDRATSVQETSDGSYVLAGRTESFGTTPSNLWVLKLESNGNIGSSCSLINTSSAAAVNSAAVTTVLPAKSATIPVKTIITSAAPLNVTTTILQLC
ncbi:hypothetical protein L0222_30785 [bacterium]|nr:hypothetical protein [bacterium]